MTTDKIELLKMWVAALRSGEYEQTRGRLCYYGGRYCCLGVGYEVLIKDGHPVKREHLGYRDDEHSVHVIEGMPGSYFKKAFGFPPIGKLHLMNDAERKSFSEIADYIESVVIQRNINTNVKN